VTAPTGVLDHATAVQVLLDAQLPASVGVAIGSGVGLTAPYAVVYPDPGTPEGSLGDRYRDLLVEFQVTCVGAGPQQAMDVAGRVRTVLLTQLPVISGRVVQPLWQEPTGERLRRDDDVSPPLWYLPLIFQMRTEPGP
jgi:hypothetical protein